MKVLKTFEYTLDGIRNLVAKKGEDAPDKLDEATFDSLVASGHIGTGSGTKAMGRRDVENKDMGSQQAAENKDPDPDAIIDGNDNDVDDDETDDDDDVDGGEGSNQPATTEIPEDFADLDADDMKALAKKLTNQDYRTKTQAKKAIAEVYDSRQAG